VCDGSLLAAALVVRRGRRGPGVKLASGEGDRFTHCIDTELVEEAAHRRCSRIDMAMTGCCSRFPVAAPSLASLQPGAIAESLPSPYVSIAVAERYGSDPHHQE
jgi:hypothetical protein